MYGDGFTSRSTRYTSSGSTGSTRSKRCDEHDLEDVAVEDVLLGRVDGRGPRVGAEVARARSGSSASSSARRQRGQVRQAAGRARRPRCRGARPRRRTCASSSTVRRRRAAGRRSRSGTGAGGSGRTRRRCPRASTPRRGSRGRRAAIVGQALDLAHGVVAHPADDAAVERRQLGQRRRAVARASSASSAASVPAVGRARLRAARARRATRRAGPRVTNVRAGSRPRNENRPQRSACSTDSSRKPSRSPTSFTNADSGVSRSASTSRHTGTTV